MVRLLGTFGFLVVILRAAILCFQSLGVGGVLFLLVVARKPEQRREELLRPAWKLIRASALAVAVAQLFFIVTNSLVLSYSADIPMREVLGANFVSAGAMAILGGLAIAFWPEGLRRSVNPIVLLPAAMMLAATVVTSHSASRMEARGWLVASTIVHYLATASWIGGLPYLLIAMKRVKDADLKTRLSQNFSRLAMSSVILL